jgi:hypothetical protein
MDKIPGLSLAKVIVYILLSTFILWLLWGYTGLPDTYRILVKRALHLVFWAMFIWGFFMPETNKLISFSKSEPSHYY